MPKPHEVAVASPRKVLGAAWPAGSARSVVSGIASAGPLAGKRLTVLPHEVTFWFVWSAFQPDTEVRTPRL